MGILKFLKPGDRRRQPPPPADETPPPPTTAGESEADAQTDGAEIVSMPTSTGDTAAEIPAPQIPKTAGEGDNVGRRLTRFDQAEAWRRRQEENPGGEPYLCHHFTSALTARDALLALDFMLEATDTGNLVCLRPLTYGCYRCNNGKYEALVGGRQLSAAVWTAVRAAFVRHGGSPRGSIRPERFAAAGAGRFDRRVTFVHEYTHIGLQHTRRYRVYRAPNAVTARSFLRQKENVVLDESLCIRVETPEGAYIRDSEGIRPEPEKNGVG